MCFGTPLIIFTPLHSTPYAFYSSLITHSLYLKLRFPSLVPYIYTPCQRPRKNQRRNNRSSPMGEIRTKDEPKNAKSQNMRFINIVVSFPSLISCLILPRELREMTERRAAQHLDTRKCFFLRLRT